MCRVWRRRGKPLTHPGRSSRDQFRSAGKLRSRGGGIVELLSVPSNQHLPRRRRQPAPEPLPNRLYQHRFRVSGPEDGDALVRQGLRRRHLFGHHPANRRHGPCALQAVGGAFVGRKDRHEYLRGFLRPVGVRHYGSFIGTSSTESATWNWRRPGSRLSLFANYSSSRWRTPDSRVFPDGRRPPESPSALRITPE